jgi:hypothetical protein
MSAKRTAEPSPESLARANRRRQVQEEGAQALADVQRQAVDIRANMQRLRILREARLTEEARSRTAHPPTVKKKRKTRIAG